MKRFGWMLSAIVLVLALIAGCSSGNNAPSNDRNNNQGTSSGDSAGQKKNITLSLMASQGWIKDPEMELAKKFEEETGIAIDYQIVPADQYFNVLKTKLNAKEGPDIFMGQSGVSEISVNLNVAENAIDLSDQEWVQRADPLSIEQVTLDDKVYGLTIWDTSGSFVIAYNKTIFADLGLSTPKTYEDLKNVGLTLLDNGITPLFEPIADGWHHVMWFSEPGPRHEEITPNLYDDLNDNKVKFADVPSFLESLEQLKEMYDLGFFGDNTFSDSGSETPNKLASGEFAMSLAGQSVLNSIEELGDQYTAEDFGFFVIPLVDNQIYYLHPGGPSKFIYSGSNYQEEAKQFLAYLATPENLQFQLDNDTTVANLNFPGLQDKYNEQQREMFAAYPKRGTDIQNYVNYVNPQWMDMAKDLEAMFVGGIEPLEVLKNIDKRREEMATVAKDPGWSN